uniref:U4/U6 small nuclear ribonucleoprotein Prp31 n=1 Tax=Meloidogyne javanica TaxID=6303 RepID=A0A915N588_MELJA
MSLAQELLADLEEEGDDELEDLGVKKEEEDDFIDEITEEKPLIDTTKYERVTDVAKLTNSANYMELKAELNKYVEMEQVPKITIPIESDPQYILVVRFSELATEIDQEMNVIHKFVRDKYEKRFPELESLVQMPLDYINTVKLLGNDIDTNSRKELDIIMEACSMAEELYDQRMKMHMFVELRMSLIAPNLCRIVGAGTAAMIVSQCGGLTPVAKMPACNVLILGKQKKTLSGFSSSAILPHTGFIYHHPIVQSLQPDLRRKAARLIAAKCTLAARIDSIHSSMDGRIGEQLMQEVKLKLEKMQEPPPVKNRKPLPKPLDKASKKRGGKRVRKQKELLKATELRKKANRMNFGELQEDVMQDHIGFTMGQAKSSSLPVGSRIRAAVVDNKTRVKMSQKLQKTIEKTRQHGGVTSIAAKGHGTTQGSVAGTASAISFTPIHGLELVTPIQKEAGKASTYFQPSTNFIAPTGPALKKK